MKRLLLTLLLAAPHAYAWDYVQNGSGQQIGDNATGAQANASQHQGQHQTATGGSATSQGGASSVSVNNSMLSGGSDRAPDVFVPSVGGGGADCPVVGIGAGGSGLGGGGGFGPSWISTDCNKRKVADLLSRLYGPSVARAYAEQNIDGVKEAVKATTFDRRPMHPAWCVDSKGRWLRDLEECGEDPR
jgi:hypothetical protein